MKINWLSLSSILFAILLLNVWRISEYGSYGYFIGIGGYGYFIGVMVFALIGWWWRK